MERICFICKVNKPLEEFWNDKRRPLGKAYFCKDCGRIKRRERDNSPKYLKKHKLYQTSKRGIMLRRLRQRKDYKENKYKYIAKKIIKELTKDGKIIPKICEMCGNKKTIAHHPDYSKPEEVIWLCQKHHSMVHRK